MSFPPFWISYLHTLVQSELREAYLFIKSFEENTKWLFFVANKNFLKKFVKYFTSIQKKVQCVRDLLLFIKFIFDKQDIDIWRKEKNYSYRKDQLSTLWYDDNPSSKIFYFASKTIVSSFPMTALNRK